MVRYRVIYTTDGAFGCEFKESKLLETDVAISRKEIARRLDLDIDKIENVEVI